MLYCHVLAYCHLFIFFFNDTATTEIYTLSLHDALPILKARRVKGLRPGMRLDDAAERIVRVRLGELCALAAKSQRPDRVEELHDARIAAKRLRYVLEITAPCFGPYAETATKKVKALQDLLGEIHDCDVMLPRLEELRVQLRDRDAAHL